LIPRLAPLPGAEAIGMASDLPFEGNWSRIITPEGSSAASLPIVNFTLVFGDYFQALGAPLRRGRFLNEADRRESQLALVVNETFARRFWPGEDPIGKRVNGELRR